MSNQVSTYDFHKSNIRVITSEDGVILFCLADVCASLNLTNATVIANQIKDEFELPKLNLASFDTGYGVKEFTMITEPQLYFVMMRSRAKVAREFRQWVCNEVLPSIRAHGAYVAKAEEPKAQARKCWYVEQLTALFESYGVNREVLARALDITSRAFKQGYAIGINKAEEDHARNDSEMLLSDDEAQAIDHVVYYHKLFRPDILKACKELRDIKAQAMKLVLALDNIPDARLYESAVATDISAQRLKRFNTTKVKKGALVVGA
ncbi:MAG: hypothetical protein IJ254_02995 [Succinivibrio sp.]|nr:hypothetical protein [Succinivibrio sp.]